MTTPLPHNPLQSAIALHRAGKLVEAEAAYRRLLEAEVRNAQGWNFLGICCGMQGKFSDAVTALRAAVAADPNFGPAHANLGNALRELGRIAESEQACRRATEVTPRDPSGWNNLAATLLTQKKLAETIEATKRALAIRPDMVEAIYNQAVAVGAAGDPEESLVLLRRAVKIQPAHALSQILLANRLRDLGQIGEAMEACRCATAAMPASAEAYNTMSMLLAAQGRVGEAIDAARRAIELLPAAVEAGDQLLLTLHYADGVTPRELYDEHLAWAKRNAAPAALTFEQIDRDPDRPLRVGYVSADFRQHAASHFLRGPIAAHDRQKFQVFCYSEVSAPDAVTERFRSMDVNFFESATLSNADLAARISHDRIDILIDCNGHTAGQRLAVFMKKPAPVQVTYLGYPNTSGMKEIGWRMTDSIADPAGEADELHTERLMRLDPCAWCYTPPDESVGAEVPARPGGPVTFGSVSILAKLTPRWAGCWAEILKRVDGSKLLMKTSALRDEGTRKRVRDLFGSFGIEPPRIELLGPQRGLDEHLRTYQRIDISLDTFPYNGTTTTCESMWMGVPVVTMSGDRHASRVGASLLGAVGMNELMARSPEEYVATAAKLAMDEPRRREIRSSLRERMRDSLLTDSAGYARRFEGSLRKMWQDYCASCGGKSSPLT